VTGTNPSQVQCASNGLSIAEVVMANEALFRARAETERRLDGIVATMNACVERGLLRVPLRSKNALRARFPSHGALTWTIG
jgi:L-serine deaminase